MRKDKTFGCVRMKWDTQRRQEEEFKNVPEAEKRRALMERVRQNPLLSPFLPGRHRPPVDTAKT